MQYRESSRTLSFKINTMKDKFNRSLEGKRIVLLGGTSGFGLATAKLAACEGANVVVVSSRKQRVDSALAALPAGSEGYIADMTDEQQVQNLFKQIGELDHLVFTAGENLQFGELSAIDNRY